MVKSEGRRNSSASGWASDLVDRLVAEEDGLDLQRGNLRAGSRNVRAACTYFRDSPFGDFWSEGNCEKFICVSHSSILIRSHQKVNVLHTRVLIIDLDFSCGRLSPTEKGPFSAVPTEKIPR